MLIGDFVEYWYNTFRVMRHAPSTVALARNYINIHIKPSALGQMDITEAKTVDYQVFLRDLLMSGNKSTLPSLNTYGQPLSHWTVIKIRQMLIAACRWAIQEGIIVRNYAEETEPIPIVQKSASVFTNKDGSPVNPMYFSRNFKNVCKRLGFPADMHLHCTRHTWATNMLQCGVPISDVQDLGGWTTPDILLRIYAHTIKESHKKAIAKLYQVFHGVE